MNNRNYKDSEQEDQRYILIVDNDKQFVGHLESLLNRQGYICECAFNRIDAENHIKQFSAHVMLLNPCLEANNGVHLIEQLKRVRPRTLCVIMSEDFFPELTIESFQKGAYDFLKKPINDGELVSSLERCFDKIKLEKEKASFEIALLEAEERYRTLVETMNDGLIVQNNEEIITYVNERLCQIAGYPKRGLIGSPAAKLFDKRNREIFQKQLIHIKQGRPGLFEITMTGKEGNEIPTIFSTQQILNPKGEFDGSFAVITDIREQIKSKEKIKESEGKYKRLFEESLDAIVIITREGKFIDVNPAAFKLLEYQKPEMMDIPVQRIYENMDELIQFQLEIEKTGYVKDHKARFRKKDGTLMHCLVNANLHKEKDGTVLGYQAIVRDITEKRRLESQILQAQKMESIGTLASGIAHDFNNLLMGMRGKTSLMLFKIDSTHPHYEKLKTIEQLIDSATGLTKQLLDFARGGKFEMKTADVNEIIRQSSDMFGRTKKEIKIHKSYQKDTWTVNADPGQIEQVLLNMYVNAAQAMPDGGDIHISAENVVLTEEFVKPFQIKPGKYVKLSVKDGGIGMDEKIIQKIFDPFFTTKVAEKGSGLGLSTTYGIIRKHGGIIDVYSEKGKGSTFDIYLRASEKPLNNEASNEDKIQQQALTGSETVLVVDDESVIVDHIKEMLETLGYKVVTALSGKEGIKIYKQNQHLIDVVILDMIMPEMKGSEVYEHLKSINPGVNVLLASGYTADDKVLEIVKEDHCRFIQKPFDIIHLSYKVREVIDSGSSI